MDEIDALRKDNADRDAVNLRLHEENDRLKASIEVKNAALLRAGSIFMEYAHHHFAKGTEEGDKKAKKNRTLASIMQEALK